MKVKINGSQKEISHAQNLKDIIAQFCKDSNHVIAELNGEIVKKQYWAQQAVNEGDSLELVNFVGGG